MRLSSGKSSKNNDSGDKKVESTRRSERLGKQTAPNVSAVTRKSMRLEPQPQSTPSPVRRSGRFQTTSAEKASSSINSHSKKGLKEKSVEQVTTESAEVSLGSAKRKILNARSYKALFKKQKKIKGGEGKFDNQVNTVERVTISQPLEHCENGSLQCGLKGLEPPLEGSLASSSNESIEKVLGIDVESEFAYPDLSLSDKPPGDYGHENDKTNGFVDDCLNSSIVNMKEISVACGSKTDPSKFVEYWVPVPLSNVQLEHYCATLLDGKDMLCSSSKKDYVGGLSNILKVVQKCCDHPSLVDPTLPPKLKMKESAPHDLLNVEIKASGKLQLLDMILSKCRRPKLKVLILYQSFAGSGGIGNILDGYMTQKYGENSYGRLESSFIPSKRQETLVKKFNDKEGEQFVLLLEHRACSQSVKLLLVDFVIIFNTELGRPATELMDLQKISIAQTKQIKVFRLYSCHTLEEKILILAKHHKSVNITHSTNRTMSDSVLMWGASVLFERLHKFHGDQSTSFSLDFFYGQQSLLDDIVKNFMDKIINEPEDKCEHGSMITRAFFSEGFYNRDKLLLGEKDVHQTDEVDRQLFWKKLLEGRKLCWKFWEPSKGSLKRGTYDEKSETATKHQKVVDTRDTASIVQPEVESGDQDAVPKADFDQPTSENEQTSLHEFLKDEMEKLCLVLQLSMDIKQVVGAFLEYVIKNHQVNKEPASILHAFQLSMCWAAAKILKKKMNKRETLILAKNALQFQCTDEEAYSVYEKLRALKKPYQQLRRKNNVLSAPLSAALDIQNVKTEDKEGSSCPELSEQLSVNELNGSCLDKKIKKLQKQHEKEILDFHQLKEQEKSRLESDHQIESAFIRKTYPENGTARSMLMQLDNELKKKIQEHGDLVKEQFEDLQTRHSAEKKKMVDEWRTKEEMSRIAEPPVNRVPDELFRIEVADCAGGSESSMCAPENELLGFERAGSKYVTVVQAEEASQVSPHNPTANARPVVGGVAYPDKLLEIEHRVEPVKGVEPSKESNSQNNGPSARTGGSEVGDPHTLEMNNSLEVNTGDGVENSVSSHATGIHNNEPSSARDPSESESGNVCFSQAETGDNPMGSEATGEHNIPAPQSSREEMAPSSALLSEAERGDNPMGSSATGEHNVPAPQSSREAMAPSSELLLEAERGDNPMGSEATGEHSIPAPQSSREEMAPSSELLQKNVHEKTGTLASEFNKLSVDAVNHLHIERAISSPVPAVSAEMVEGSMEIQHQVVSQNMGMASVEEMDSQVDLGSEATGEHSIPAPQSSREEMATSLELLQKNVHEKTGTLASECNKLSVDAVNHLHIERAISSPVPAVSAEMVEGSMEIQHQVVSQNMGMASVEEMNNQVDLETVGRANDGPSVELPAASQNVLAPLLFVESLTRPRNQFLVQSEPTLVVAEGPTQLHVNLMHHIGSRVSTLASHTQSLQSELDYLRKEREQMIKHFDGRKSSLKSECEREVEQVRMKYAEKLKEVESAFKQDLTQVDSNYNVASMHKTLSDALQFKCSEGNRTPGNSTMQQAAGVSPRFIQQMHQAQGRMRHHSPATLSSASHLTTMQQNVFSPAQNHRPSTFSSTGHPAMGLPSITSSSVQSHHRSSGPFASARPPQISSITPSVSSTRVGGEIRSQAPHLQPYRPPSNSAPRLPANILMPTQLMTAPSVPAQISLRPNPPSQSLSPLHQNGAPRNHLNLSVSAMELLMTNAPRNAAGSASDPSANRPSGNVSEGIARSDSAASDVVCLSDDES